jgi:flagellin
MENTVDTSIPYLTSLSYLQTQSLNKENAKSQEALSKSIEHISTGLRVINAGDDLAGFAIADRMDVQVQGMTKAIQNTNEALTAVRVVESSLNEYTDILGYMKELAEKATHKNLELNDRRTLQEEITNLQDRLKGIANETTFRGRKLLDGTYRTQNIQVGGSVGEVMSVSLKTARPDQIGLHQVVSGGTMNENNGKVNIEYAAILNGVDANDSITIQGHSGAEYIDITPDFSAKDIADAINQKSDLTGIEAKANTYLKVFDMKNLAGTPAPTINVSFTIHGSSDVPINATISPLDVTSEKYDLEPLYEELDSKYAATHIKPQLSPDHTAVYLHSDEGYDIGIEDFSRETAGFTILSLTGLETDAKTATGSEEILVADALGSFRISGYIELQSEEPFIVFTGSNDALFSSSSSTYLPTLKALDNIDISFQENAEEALDIIERANSYVENIRSDVQAYESGFEAIIQRLESATEHMETSKHRIVDNDLVHETMVSSKATIQIQSQNSLLTQANRLIPEYSLFLLRQ